MNDDLSEVSVDAEEANPIIEEDSAVDELATTVDNTDIETVNNTAE